MSVSNTLMCHQMPFPSWVLHSTVVQYSKGDPLDNEGLIRNSQALVRKTQEVQLYLHPCLGSDTYEDSGVQI